MEFIRMGKLDGKYALANNGELITDFIYDECGSCGNDELIAVCKDGNGDI